MLRGFDFVSGNPDCNRALNQIDGNHQAQIGVHAYQNSFDAIQRSAADPNFLIHAQERVRRYRHSLVHQRLHRFNLLIGDRRPFALVPYKTRNAETRTAIPWLKK